MGAGQWEGVSFLPQLHEADGQQGRFASGEGALVVGGRGSGLRAMGAGQRGSDCGSAAQSDTCLSTSCSTTTCLSICYSASPPATQPLHLLLSQHLPCSPAAQTNLPPLPAAQSLPCFSISPACPPTAQSTAAGRLPAGEGVHAQVARHPLCKHRGSRAVKLA